MSSNIYSTIAAQLVQEVLLPNVQGRLDHCAEDPGTSRLFVSCLGSDCVAVIDLFAGCMVQRIDHHSIYRPQGLCFADGLLAIASLAGITLVTFGDADEGSRGSSHVPPMPPLSFLHVPCDNCDNIRVWKKKEDAIGAPLLVALGEDDAACIAFFVIKRRTAPRSAAADDGGSCELSANLVTDRCVKLGNHPEGFVVLRGGSLVACNVADSRAVILLGISDAMEQTLLAQFPLPDGVSHNFPLQCSIDQERIFVGARRPPCVLELTVVAPPCASGGAFEIRHTRTWATEGADCDDLFVFLNSGNKRELLAVVNGSGGVDVLDSSVPPVDRVVVPQQRAVATIATSTGARTGWVSASRRKLYVCVPQSSHVSVAHVKVFDLLSLRPEEPK